MMHVTVMFDDETEEYVWAGPDDVEICFVKAIPDATHPDRPSWAVFDTCGEAMNSFENLDLALGWATSFALKLSEPWAGDGPPHDAATATGMYDG